MKIYLNDIFQKPGQAHSKANQKFLDNLGRLNLLSVWKMVNKICFLGYVIPVEGNRIEDKKIEAVKSDLN